MYGSDDIPVGVLRGKYIAFGCAWAYLSETNHSLNLSALRRPDDVHCVTNSCGPCTGRPAVGHDAPAERGAVPRHGGPPGGGDAPGQAVSGTCHILMSAFPSSDARPRPASGRFPAAAGVQSVTPLGNRGGFSGAAVCAWRAAGGLCLRAWPPQRIVPGPDRRRPPFDDGGRAGWPRFCARRLPHLGNRHGGGARRPGCGGT